MVVVVLTYTTLIIFINVGGPKRVGGTGSLRARGGNGAEFVLLNGGSDFTAQTSMSENGNPT